MDLRAREGEVLAREATMRKVPTVPRRQVILAGDEGGLRQGSVRAEALSGSERPCQRGQRSPREREVKGVSPAGVPGLPVQELYSEVRERGGGEGGGVSGVWDV